MLSHIHHDHFKVQICLEQLAFAWKSEFPRFDRCIFDAFNRSLRCGFVDSPIKTVMEVGGVFTPAIQARKVRFRIKKVPSCEQGVGFQGIFEFCMLFLGPPSFSLREVPIVSYGVLDGYRGLMSGTVDHTRQLRADCPFVTASNFRPTHTRQNINRPTITVQMHDVILT
jgi:hypothetical protein